MSDVPEGGPADGEARSVRETLASLERGDLGAFVSALDDDVVWHVNGRGPVSGTHAGQPSVARLFEERMSASDGSYRLEILDFLESPEHAVAMHVSRARRATNLESLGVTVMHVSHGAIIEAWEYAYDPRATDEFWA